jgi:hypothetical protein
MPSTRRSFLAKTGLATLLGVGTAGCLDTVDDAIGTDGPPTEYATWLYDPNEVLESDYVGFGTYDVRSLYENETHLPDGMMERIDVANDEMEFVDLESVAEMTGLAYGHPRQETGGGSMTVSGEFDLDEIETRIEEGTAGEYETDSYEGYTLYTVSPDGETAAAGVETGSMTIAVSSDRVVVGGMRAPDATSDDAVQATIDAGDGDVARLHETNDDASEVVSQLGDATMVLGGTFDADLTNLANEGTDPLLIEVVDDLVAVGLASDVDGASVAHSMAFVYESEDAASTSALQDAVDRVKAESDPANEQLDDASVSRDGRTVVLSATGDTKAFFRTIGLFGVGTTTSGMASGTASASMTVSEPPEVPQVRFEFEYRDDGRVVITHQAGDHVEGTILVRYAHEGDHVMERWTPSDGIQAGDRHVTDRSADPGSEVHLVWENEDGQSVVLASFVVPE